MAHIMLPISNKSKKLNFSVGKYADTAIEYMIDELQSKGCSTSSLQAKLAGGAQMFSFSGGSDIMRVGTRNVEAIKELLYDLGIPIVSEDTGGSHGRTIEFNIINGALTIRTIGKGEKTI